MKKLAACAAAFALLGTIAAFADAHADRQALMRANGAATNAIDGIIIGVLKPADIKAQAQILIDNGGKMAALFAPGTDQNDPGALPAVWTDPAGFKAATDKFVADAKVLLAPSTDRVALVRALQAVQADCAACHRTYRVPPPPAAGRGGRRGGAPPEDAAGAANAVQ